MPTTGHPPELRASEVGEYIRYRSCERRFKLEYNGRDLARKLPFYNRLFNTLDVVLQRVGHDREDLWADELIKHGLLDLVAGRPADTDEDHPGWDEFATAAERQIRHGQQAFAREVRLGGRLGGFLIRGRADFLILRWVDGEPRLRVVECKASRRDRTYHRLQVSIYRSLLRQHLKERPLILAGQTVSPDMVEAVVARIDETTNANQDILALEPLDLEMEDADVERLVTSEGALARILQTDIDDIGFKLDPKCDGCVFNVHCLSESGRQRRIELTGCNVSSATVLRSTGVTTIDNLAELDKESELASQIRANPAFSDDLDQLVAIARARRTTLPGAIAPADGGDAYPVEQLPNAGQSQLPMHVIEGERLVRVYLNVDYDYTENRIGALAAHITASPGHLRTGFIQQPDGKWIPDPEMYEEEAGSRHAVRGRSVHQIKLSQWTGDYAQDTGAERELIQNFLVQIIGAVAEVAGDPALGGAGDGLARIHFYVWSRSEMSQLVEACSRASSNLLRALRELLGSRDGLEQMIYSCLQNEVDNRFALGWTGRGLAVVTSLKWYGHTFHWNRKVNGKPLALDRIFTQDLFDFKTNLWLGPDGQWCDERDIGATRERFEIRSRFHDTLPAPYWHAVWNTLPDPDGPEVPAEARTAIKYYNKAAKPNVLSAYLIGRTHALRWLDEHIQFKNGEIGKPRLVIDELRVFDLGVDDTRMAAVDFLRLDHAVKVTDWIGAHLRSVRSRLPGGRTIPLINVVLESKDRVTADFGLDPHGIKPPDLEAICSIGEGSFVRISPYSGDPARGQTYKQLVNGGLTCRVEVVDWAKGQVVFSPMNTRRSRYLLLSIPGEPRSLFDYATADESPSDFVAGRVDNRLMSTSGTHVGAWFDPEAPSIPEATALQKDDVDSVRRALLHREVGKSHGLLSEDQVDAVLAGLNSRIQLLQGPPGTGKTQTTAVAILTRIAARIPAGSTVMVAAHTHTAADTLLRRIRDVEAQTRGLLTQHGLTMPEIRLAKVHSTQISNPIAPIDEDIKSIPSATKVKNLQKDAVAIIGGTTGALLKMSKELDGKKPWIDGSGFQVPMLIVDEASMMVFPHFLSLASIVSQNGYILLAGDHRQLAPIVAHDWENEDRPPAVKYQPYVSSYAAVRQIADHLPDASITASALHTTFRLPPAIIELISRLYELDDITLQGVARETKFAGSDGDKLVGDFSSGLEAVWDGPSGLYVVIHDERDSRQSNAFEASLIKRIIDLDPNQQVNSTAVLTPHRAQRSLLKKNLDGITSVGIVDTVERLQGGERPNVIVSGTVSEPNSIAQTESFLLDLNRSNVAFSRCQNRLVVVCARTLLDHVPAELDTYQSAMLWKALRSLCSKHVGSDVIDNHAVQVLTLPLDTLSFR